MLWKFWDTGGLDLGLDGGFSYRRSFSGNLEDSAHALLSDSKRSEFAIDLCLTLGRF